MSRIVPELNRMPAPLTVPGHSAALGYTYGGMGNPGSLDCLCSCGWSSRWEEWGFSLDVPITEIPGLAKDFVQTVVDVGGMREWNAQRENCRFGDTEQALADILDHLGLTIQQARAQTRRLIHERTVVLAEALRQAASETENLHEWVARIQEADQRLDEAERLSEFLERVTPDPFIGLSGRVVGSRERMSSTCGKECRAVEDFCRQCPEFSRDEIMTGLWVGGGRQPREGFSGRVLTLDDAVAHTNPYAGDVTVAFEDAEVPEGTVLAACVDMIDEALASGEAILIRCHSGLNRAPFVAAYWLITRMGAAPWEAVECLRVARDRRGDYALSNAAFVRFLLDLARKPTERESRVADLQRQR